MAKRSREIPAVVFTAEPMDEDALRQTLEGFTPTDDEPAALVIDPNLPGRRTVLLLPSVSDELLAVTFWKRQEPVRRLLNEHAGRAILVVSLGAWDIIRARRKGRKRRSVPIYELQKV